MFSSIWFKNYVKKKINVHLSLAEKREELRKTTQEIEDASKELETAKEVMFLIHRGSLSFTKLVAMSSAPAKSARYVSSRSTIHSLIVLYNLDSKYN